MDPRSSINPHAVVLTGLEPWWGVQIDPQFSHNIRAPFSLVWISPVYFGRIEVLLKWEKESGFGMSCLEVAEASMSQRLILTAPTWADMVVWYRLWWGFSWISLQHQHQSGSNRDCGRRCTLVLCWKTVFLTQCSSRTPDLRETSSHCVVFMKRNQACSTICQIQTHLTVQCWYFFKRIYF